MIVVADDITGAAEIAGMAFLRGFPTHLSLGLGGDPILEIRRDEVHVFATDSRSMTVQEAVAETRCLSLPSFFHSSGGEHLIFKKTDSALRGHVIEECQAIMQALGYSRVVYVPANPSKGRIIREGIYYVNGIPIHQTEFALDPEYPAKSSILKERFPDAEAHHVIIPDATSNDDILSIIAHYNDGRTLFAGAADLFTCLLTTLFPSKFVGTGNTSPIHHQQFANASDLVLVCGSTQRQPFPNTLPEAPMPRDVYDGKAPFVMWLDRAQRIYAARNALMLTIPHHHLTGRDVAVRLRKATAFVVSGLIQQHRPQRLFIEGGATAFACLNTVGWRQFRLYGVLAPGVVAMTADSGTMVVMKPGSYAWG